MVLAASTSAPIKRRVHFLDIDWMCCGQFPRVPYLRPVLLRQHAVSCCTLQRGVSATQHQDYMTTLRLAAHTHIHRITGCYCDSMLCRAAHCREACQHQDYMTTLRLAAHTHIHRITGCLRNRSSHLVMMIWGINLMAHHR
jgi:hypothetical protein